MAPLEITELMEEMQRLRERIAELERSSGREHDQRITSILDSITDSFIVVDRHWNLSYVNNNVLTAIGKRADEVIGKNLWDLFPDAAKSEFYPQYHRVMNERIPLSFNVYYPSRDAWFQVNAHPVEDGLSAYVQNITHRMRVEIALLESQEKYHFLAAALPQFVWTGDSEGRTEFLNRYWYEYTGMREDQRVTEQWRLVAHPDDYQTTIDRWNRAHAAGEEYSMEVRIKRAADGQYRWHLARYKPVRDGGGRIFKWIGTAIDIDEQKQAVERLRRNDERLKVALQASSTGTWSWDIIAHRFTKGENLNRMLGLPAAETTEEAPDYPALAHPEDQPKLVEVVKSALDGGGEFDVDFRIVRPDGIMRWFRTRGNVLRNEEGRPVYVTGACVDITDRKQAEEALVRQARELARSNADLQHFAYVTSHDLQEPLRMIASFAELLAQRYRGKLDTDADEFIGYIISGAHRMDALIRDLLAYSRVVNTEGVTYQPVELEGTLHWATMNLQKAIAETGAIITHDELPVALGDQVQLVQVLQNLISNALKYRSQEKPHVHISAERSDAEWIISVRDNGIGIAPEYHDRIFGVFKRLHGRDYPGTGIGLAICKAVVEKHGGRIWVESEAGQGATFRFTLAAE